MKKPLLSFLHGMCTIGACVARIGFCSAVKSICRKHIKRMENHCGNSLDLR